MTPDEPGLRERKKAKTRLLISGIATKMFQERGFDAVTVAEVAAAAEVSVATLFNYFETKEDLFFDRDAEVLAAHVRFVRDRKKGESIPSAMRRAFHASIDDASMHRFLTGGGQFLRTIEASSALRARARFALEQIEAALARTIAEETHAAKGDPTPRVVAGLLVSIERVLVADASAAVLRGEGLASAKRKLKKTCDLAFALLERGAGAYGR
ncbi:MAG TPA: TetR family transcriptional regulator [Polyangiaceae bacterium]|jgi:AcrR family transcriptional regulator